MAKGSPTITFRIPQSLLDAVSQEIERTNQNVRVAPFTVSSWIVAAIREKIAHAKRSRMRRKKQHGPIIPADGRQE